MKDAPAKVEPLPGALLALRAVDRRIQQVEVALCVAAFLLMIGLAFAQVFLRTFRGGALQPVAWFDNIARHLVIWVGMLGASLCTAEGRHISIEALPKLFTANGRRRLDAALCAVSLGVVLVLLALSVVYMQRVQLPNEAHLFEVEALHLKVYRWPFLVIVPIGLLTIAWRLLLRGVESLVMSEAQFLEREAAVEREVLEREAQAEGERGAAGAAEGRAGGGPAPAGEAARAAVRRPSERAAPPADPRGETADARPDDAPEPPLASPKAETERMPRAGPTPAPTRRPPSGRPGVPGRSTDEIPVYRELADDEDLLEPERRSTDSSDGLDPTTREVEDAVEAVADTARMRGAGLATPDPDDASSDEAPARRAETARQLTPTPAPPSDAGAAERDATRRVDRADEAPPAGGPAAGDAGPREGA